MGKPVTEPPNFEALYERLHENLKVDVVALRRLVGRAKAAMKAEVDGAKFWHRFLRGRQAEEEGRHAAALSDFERALSLRDDLRALRHRGRVLRQLGRAAEAVDVLNEVLKRSDGEDARLRATTRINLAHALLDAGEHAGAEETLRMEVAEVGGDQNPTQAALRLNALASLGTVLARAGRHAEALQFYECVAEQGEAIDHPWADMLVANALLDAGRMIAHLDRPVERAVPIVARLLGRLDREPAGRNTRRVVVRWDLARDLPADALENEALWRDANDCVCPLTAGLRYLYDDVLESSHAGCPLSFRVEEHCIAGMRGITNAGFDPMAIEPTTQVDLVRERHTLGTLGYSLWHLRDSGGAAALRFEIAQLAQVGVEADASDSRLRGQGFLFFASGWLARRGFKIEFIARDGARTPDFFARRDGIRFACEATSREPSATRESGAYAFWQHILDVVSEKREQFRRPEFANGVLFIDCAALLDLLGPEDRPTFDTLYWLSPDESAPSGGQRALIRADDSAYGRGLSACGELMEEVGLYNLVLWERRFDIDGEHMRRTHGCRVIGMFEGRPFWQYFERAWVFPGPNVRVDYGDQ